MKPCCYQASTPLLDSNGHQKWNSIATKYVVLDRNGYTKMSSVPTTGIYFVFLSKCLLYNIIGIDNKRTGKWKVSFRCFWFWLHHWEKAPGKLIRVKKFEIRITDPCWYRRNCFRTSFSHTSFSYIWIILLTTLTKFEKNYLK